MGKLKSCGFLIFRDNPTTDAEQDSSVQSSWHLPNDNLHVSFLLLKHPNRWDLPKGHVDPGETNMQCALRELDEETGIQAANLAVDPNFKFKQKYMVSSKRSKGKPKKKRLIIYAAKLIQPVELKLTEHDGSQWFHWDPPHSIQSKTIDPLLAALRRHWHTPAELPTTN